MVLKPSRADRYAKLTEAAVFPTPPLILYTAIIFNGYTPLSRAYYGLITWLPRGYSAVIKLYRAVRAVPDVLRWSPIFPLFERVS